jgi:hypothetical protein
MLKLVDQLLAQATNSKVLNVQIPFTETTITDLIGMTSVFSSALFEFFVMVEPFDNRDIKSLAIIG